MRHAVLTLMLEMHFQGLHHFKKFLALLYLSKQSQEHASKFLLKTEGAHHLRILSTPLWRQLPPPACVPDHSTESPPWHLLHHAAFSRLWPPCTAQLQRESKCPWPLVQHKTNAFIPLAQAPMVLSDCSQLLISLYQKELCHLW